MRKSYGAPIGDYILYILGPVFIAFFALIVLSSKNVGLSQGIIYFFTALLFGWSIVFIRRVSYRLVIDGDHIIEKGFLLPHRKVNIFDIIQIVRKRPEKFFMSGFGSAPISSRQVYFEINNIRSFPWLPVTPAIVEELISVNPKIKVAKNMSGLLSHRLRKQLGLKLSIIDVIARVLGVFILVIVLAVVGVLIASLSH